MKKSIWSVSVATMMVASAFSAAPARAGHYPIPETPNIEDPAQDSNGVNDQGLGFVTGYQGDNPGGPYFGGADFLKVWFSNDASKLRVHMLTSAPGTGGNFAYVYRVHVNDECVWFQANVDGATNGAEPSAVIRDACGELESVPGEIEVEELEDGTGLTTLTYDLGSFPGIELGGSLTTPNATSRLFTPSGHTAPQLDNTVNGTDYEIAASGGEPVAQEPPKNKGKKDEAPVKKGCKKNKNKGKKKGCKKGKGPKDEPKAGCEAYVPGEQGAEAETVVVTDEHTAEAPLEITVEHDLAIFPATASDRYTNVQVDSAAEEAGLYISYQFPDHEDHDLYIHYPDGAEAASVGGFNPAPFVPATPVTGSTDGTGNGGHSEMGAEILDGLRTADCQGWTANWHNFLGEGGEYTVTVWLGEIQNDPAPPAE